jgi:hypothetical protein
LFNLNLIDWRLVGFSALWIIGLGLILATLSHADYDAARKQIPLSVILWRPGPKVALNVGLVLFSLGLLGSSGAIWEQVTWTGLALWFSVQAWRAMRRFQARRQPPQG